MCSSGYPDDYQKNIKINQLKNIKLNKDEYLFHAGTKAENEDYIAVGGRVLNVVTTTKDFKQSKEQALKILNDIDWKEGFFRKDIAYKVA